ncbi:MAG: Stp1/IreP family PP2C-type Ser/Thr phosphatase [Polyangiaceae bacterium]|nr:Stp1/IreP family PP2C-type Ser/Thr phosphatase [Polyangiaceae bacterium]
MSGPIEINVFGRTDVGQIREHNEDNFVVADLTRKTRSLKEPDRRLVVGERGLVLGVCDGMGGAAAGEVASQLAVDIIYEKLANTDTPPDRDELARRLVHAIEEAGSRIYNDARADRSRRGMGTTSTVAALVDEILFVGQVGDSRAYLLRDGKLVQVSRDQSLVTQLIEAGQLTEEEAENFEHNNIILQALGTAETVQVDLTHVELRRGDVLLLCSDGLSGMVRNDEIREVLVANPEPFDACRVLIERANAAGGHDNVTVIVAQFGGDGVPERAAADPPVGYRKYALPETTRSAPTLRTATPSSTDIQLAHAPSAEASRESRRLRVGHTMVGMTNPLAGVDLGGAAPPASAPPPTYSGADEPVDIPTTGMPPRVVGLLVVGAFVLLAVAGSLLLR